MTLPSVSPAFVESSVIAGRLFAARRIRGWTQQQFAAHSGLDQRQISRIERGEAETMSLRHFLMCAASLEISLDVLAGVNEMAFLSALVSEEAPVRDAVADVVRLPAPFDGLLPSGGIRPGTLTAVVGESAQEVFLQAVERCEQTAPVLLSHGVSPVLTPEGALGLHTIALDEISLPVTALQIQARKRNTRVLATADGSVADLLGSPVGRDAWDHADLLFFVQEGQLQLVKNRFGPTTVAAGA